MKALANEKQLWTQNGVEAIREIEKQRRQEAEAKKEELRQLVGRRYRVLLESADWIEEMKDLSKHTLLQLDQVALGIAQLEKRKALSKTVKKSTDSHTEGVAEWAVALGLDQSRIKGYIARLPEKIWEVLRVHEYMQATELYFQALGLMDTLPAGPDQTLERHALTIKQFPHVMVRMCKKRLKAHALPLQEQTKALCAIWMLAGISLVEAVRLYFDCRATAIGFVSRAAEQALAAGVNNDSDSKARMVVTAIEDLAKLLQSSIQHAAVIFGPVSLSNRLRVETGSPENIHLSLQRFRNDMAPSFLPVFDRYSGAKDGPTDLQEIGGTWMKEIVSAISNDCTRLLRHLERGQHIGKARDGLLACLVAAEVGPEGKPRQDGWRHACTVVLGRSVALWDEAFLEPFQARFKAIISLSFARLSLDVMLEQVQMGSHEEAKDRWTRAFKVVPVGTLCRKPGLEDEARGLGGSRDEALLAIWSEFNAQLALVVNDVSHILQVPAVSSIEQKSSDRSLKSLLRSELRPFVHTTATEAIAKLTTSIRSRLKGLESQILEPSGSSSPFTLVDQTVFVSRVCAHLLAASKPLKELEAFEISETGGQSFVHQSIHNVYRAGLGIWTRFIAFTLSDALRLALGAWLEQWRLSPTQPVQWPVDNASQMSVPSQPSPCISQFLLQLMEEVYRVYGHVVSQDVIACVITDVTASALSVLSEFAEAAKLTEPAALQLVFDVKYLFSVLRLPKAREGGLNPREHLLALLQKLEALVDPIDYALVGPVIGSRISQLMVTSAVLFGVLVKANPFPEPFPPVAAATEQKESAVIVAAAQPMARVQTLPIKLYPSKKSKAATVEALAREDAKLPPRASGGAPAAFKVPPTIGALGDRLGNQTKELLGKWGLSYS